MSRWSGTRRRWARRWSTALGGRVRGRRSALGAGGVEPLGIRTVPGNRVVLLHDGPQTYRSMLKAIAGARHSINLETYIFADNPVGWRFARALAERAQAGVAVHVLYDAMGSANTGGALWDFLRTAGVKVRPFHPLSEGLIKAWRRNHRKLLIVDGRTAYVGGHNIGDSWAGGRAAMPPWRDLHAQLQGPAVSQLQGLFFANWTAAGGTGGDPADLRYYPPLYAQGPCAVALSACGDERSTRALYLQLLAHARKRVLLVSAYFYPDEAILTALCAAARRGVRVRLLLPAQSDIGMMVDAARSRYGDLLAAGIEIAEYQPSILHMKAAVVDGRWALVGSSNLDPHSLDINYEVNIAIAGGRVVGQLERRLQRDLRRSRRLTLASWRRRSLLQRLHEVGSRVVIRLVSLTTPRRWSY